MARDRKRAKQRRQRQQAPARARQGGGTPAPAPLEDSSAEVEQAEAAISGAAPVAEPDEPLTPEEAEPAPGPDGSEPSLARDDDDDVSAIPAAERALGRASADRDQGTLSRFGAFLRACWAELKRVQWPNRRQVIQATAVVLAFVVIAGGYLGLLDVVWSRVVDAII